MSEFVSHRNVSSDIIHFRLTKDVLHQNQAFADEQLDMWHQNRSGLYSAAPRTLALTVPSDLLPKDRITDLINNARNNIDVYASKYANGNSKLEQGIKVQHQISLDLYERDEQLPSELNLGKGAYMDLLLLKIQLMTL